ncbi:MAG TPA: NrfD/PsrC family molybdoenzyme membrane anchor subunit [Gemmatimonadaceae bacterium]|nr:NrfD/PsrC family molybdoenzyme membrane anchor subunit [Gemmatimonadaceae bacterium]
MSATTLPVSADTSLLTDRRDVTELEQDMLATLEPMGRAGRAWIASLLTVCTLALVAWIYQLANGLRVTDMRNYVSWGTYMTNFVFFIGISHAGTLISAILRVTDAGWRRPITRMAEAITVIALLVGASMVVIDMGRPDRVLNLILHGRFQSPILWDLVSVTTYITGSFLYLYVAMIPDMPILAQAARDAGRSPRLVRLYEILSLGFRETPEHRRRLARALGAMAVIIIPVAVSVHTVVSWVFGMTLRPGWHSTIFGPYFVIGAIFSGTAAIITAMALFRRAYHLERYLRPEHFHKLAKILLALSLLYAYFTLSEYLTTWYGGAETDVRLLDRLAGSTTFGTAFWLWAAFGLFAPIGMLLFPSRRSLGSIVTASVLVNLGMWLKRYLIVVPTLETPFLPASSAGVAPHYFPSLVECTITAGAFAAFMLLFTLFSRLFPILSIWETAEDEADEGAQESVAEAAHHRPALAAFAIAFTVGALALLAPRGAADAQTPTSNSEAAPARPANVRIALARSSEDGQDMLVGTVTADGHAVAGVTVGFSVARTFGNMTLGTDQTLSDGSAAVPFPKGLPGDRAGQLRVLATVQAPAELAGTSVTVTMPGGAPTRATTESQPRALWSTRPPLPMIATIFGLLLCVWSTYAFVVGQLIALSHVKQEG